MYFNFEKEKEKILDMLAQQTDPALKYHSVEHTLDVLESSLEIARQEGIRDEDQLLLLKVAALYHDTGFLFTYKGHEEKSCELVLENLRHSIFTADDLDVICGMIRATKIPQSPKTLLEMIICDADLDYLGRDDFDKISNRLRQEYFTIGMVTSEEEWMQIQIRFIGVHRYFTQSTYIKRTPGKLKHLKQLQLQARFNTTNQ